ncbi:PPOX class F420-dependent oxidoreductase [Dictyobacter vulcani]|uniref:PPOX class F420-dependent oxidoreductase n=1 Tax=Dictyobacter vulcani TaxID=2607529 RepID=A0A5J4KMQ6_9CHLR|nr:PPOX class F420-dependent oxidoreductase [Dictyobacter vulcani]GER87690.1 PPOX class F420-dependent oxidoreductase [Dictyobacter vulcani]
MAIENSQTTTPHPFAYLKGEQFILLKTFRKSGEALATPVWFVEDQGKLYITTVQNIGKVKRIRNNGRVLLAPCNRSGAVHGTEIEARGRELPAAEQPAAQKLLALKYGFLFKVIAFISKLRKTQQTIIEIQPMQSQA